MDRFGHDLGCACNVAMAFILILTALVGLFALATWLSMK